MLLLLIINITILTFGLSENTDVEILRKILHGGVERQVYPGAVGIVGDSNGNILFSTAVGFQTYDTQDPAVTLDTIFDLASLSKVVATTSAVALLYQHGYLALDTLVGDVLGEKWNNGGKESVTVKNCLLHNAGFAPDPVPWYWEPETGCPNTDMDFPVEDFSCLDPIIYYDSLMNEQLVTAPGEAFKYSDLSFITLQMVVGTIAMRQGLVSADTVLQCMISGDETISGDRREDLFETSPVAVVCAFKEFVHGQVFHRPDPTDAAVANWMPSSQYRPEKEIWGKCAPTNLDVCDPDDDSVSCYTHKRLQGQVADGNCYAMGGVCGHAGVFSTAPDLANLAGYLLQQRVSSSLNSTAQRQHYHSEEGLNEGPSEGVQLLSFLNASTVQLFTTINNETQSSRALGWTTNSIAAEDHGYDHSCGMMSEETFMHIGYTGTCLCADPHHRLFTVILTNR